MTASDPPPPPRAFTQGVGTVFQFVGVSLFILLFFNCCLSGLLSKDFATHNQLTTVSWYGYTAPRAISISLIFGIFLGIALAAIGLGLQAQRRLAPLMAMIVCGFATVFYGGHSLLFMSGRSIPMLAAICVVLTLACFALSMLAIGAWREMRIDPPPGGFEILPTDYKVPYSHLHQDPPEVRLAKELEQRRERLALQQKELEMLEQKLHDKLKQKPDVPIVPVDDSGGAPPTPETKRGPE